VTHHYLTYALGIILPSMAIVFSHFRLPAARRLKARTQAAIGTAVLAAVLGLSYAEIMDVRSYWSMQCYPIGGEPYTVAEADNARLLVINSTGSVREYKALATWRTGLGFVMSAVGLNPRGEQLILEATFSAREGPMRVIMPSPAPIFAAAMARRSFLGQSRRPAKCHNNAKPFQIKRKNTLTTKLA
jgi:hypothetical protein